MPRGQQVSRWEASVWVGEVLLAADTLVDDTGVADKDCRLEVAVDTWLEVVVAVGGIPVGVGKRDVLEGTPVVGVDILPAVVAADTEAGMGREESEVDVPPDDEVGVDEQVVGPVSVWALV